MTLTDLLDKEYAIKFVTGDKGKFEWGTKPSEFKALVDRVGMEALVLGGDPGGTNFDWGLYLEDKKGKLHLLAYNRVPHGYDKDKPKETALPSFLKVINTFWGVAHFAEQYYNEIDADFKPLKTGNSIPGVIEDYGTRWVSTNTPEWQNLEDQVGGAKEFFYPHGDETAIDIRGMITSLTHSENKTQLFSEFRAYNDLRANGAREAYHEDGPARDAALSITEMMGTGTNLAVYHITPDGKLVGHNAEAGWGAYFGRYITEKVALETMVNDKDTKQYEKVEAYAWEEIRSGRGCAAALKFMVDDELKKQSDNVEHIFSLKPKDQPEAISIAALEGDVACKEAFNYIGDATGAFLYGRDKIFKNPKIVLTQNIYTKNLDLIAQGLVLGYLDCMEDEEIRPLYESYFGGAANGPGADLRETLKQSITERNMGEPGAGEALISKFFNGRISIDPGTKTSLEGAALLVTKPLLEQQDNYEEPMNAKGTDFSFVIGEKEITHKITYHTPEDEDVTLEGNIGIVPFPTTEVEGIKQPLSCSYESKQPMKNLIRYRDVASIGGLIKLYESETGKELPGEVKTQNAQFILNHHDGTDNLRDATKKWANAVGYTLREVAIQFNYSSDKRLDVKMEGLDIPEPVQDMIKKAYLDTASNIKNGLEMHTKSIRYAA